MITSCVTVLDPPMGKRLCEYRKDAPIIVRNENQQNDIWLVLPSNRIVCLKSYSQGVTIGEEVETQAEWTDLYVPFKGTITLNVK